MREHLFRAKRVDNGKEVVGSLVVLKDKCFIFIETKPSKVKKLSFVTHKLIVECVEVIPETVGQFTGLKDRNGEKIFEGDIVKVLFKEVQAKYIKLKDGETIFTKPQKDSDWQIVCWYKNLVCHFDKEELAFKFGNKGLIDCDTEVIGNIHDNKELLEVEE